MSMSMSKSKSMSMSMSMSMSKSMSMSMSMSMNLSTKKLFRFWKLLCDADMLYGDCSMTLKKDKSGREEIVANDNASNSLKKK
jgi:hypothetical protein